MNGLTISHDANRPAAEGVPEDVDEEIPGAEFGFGGYSTWSPESMWAQNGELIITEDFDLSTIPAVEIGITMPEERANGEAEEPYTNSAPGHDPFAALFSYDNMPW